MRYGFVKKAQRVATALFEAADYSDGRPALPYVYGELANEY